jgi:subtilisin-like proprotein convertase family protein
VTITVGVSDGQSTTSTNFVVTVTTFSVATKSFTNAAAITIPDSGAATPYPSTINVTGMSGTITNVAVTLKGFSHTWANDVDVLLAGPGGQAIRLMENAGTGPTVNANLTFTNGATAVLPQTGALSSGNYKPTAYAPATIYPTPAPAGSFGTNFAVFNGTDANGTWSLYLLDDGAGDSGSSAGGWSVTLTTAGSPLAGPPAMGSAQPPPKITSITLEQGTIQLIVNGEVGLRYALEASQDLVSWTKLAVQDNTTGAVVFSDRPATNAIRFYRAVSIAK